MSQGPADHRPGAGGEVWGCLEPEEEAYRAGQDRGSEGFQPLRLDPVNTYRSVIESFSRSVLEKKPVEVSGEEALWNMQVLEAVYASSETGRTVEVTPL